MLISQQNSVMLRPLVLLSSAAFAAAAELPSLVPFFVEKGRDGSAAARMHTRQATVTCSFSYDARVDVQPKDDPDMLQAQALVAALKDQCAEPLTSGNFVYEVCLGPTAAARQRGLPGSPDKDFMVSMGVYSEYTTTAKGFGANRLFYEGGDKCGTTPRTAEVTLYCGSAFSVITVNEPSTCFYTLGVTHPDFCTLPRIFKEPPLAGGSASGGGGGRDNGEFAAPGLTEVGLERLRAAKQAQRELEEKRKLEEGDGNERGTLGEQDVAGMGGHSIGLDDRERHAGKWAGLDDGNEDTRSSWAISVHNTWPTTAAADNGKAVVTCFAYTTDDLRRGTEMGPAIGGSSLHSAALALSVTPAQGSTSGRQPRPKLVEALARGANRERLAVDAEVVPGADDAGDVLMVRVRRLNEGRTGEDGDAGAAVIPDVAYLSLTVQIE